MERSHVILDFVFDDGLLFVSLANIGESPATDVVVELDPRVRGAEGRELGTLKLFRRLKFLAPGREIQAFVDSAAAYFERGEPAEVAASIRWKDPDGEIRSATIHHDLGVYRDLPYVPGRPRR
jgi:hypothetical protein